MGGPLRLHGELSVGSLLKPVRPHNAAESSSADAEKKEPTPA